MNESSLHDPDFSLAVECATQAFWSSLAESYPHIKTGDIDPSRVKQLDLAAIRAARAWIETNS